MVRVSHIICGLFFITSCYASDTSFKHVCPVPCYTGPTNTNDVGICRGGWTGCDANGLPTKECIGEITPTTEVCDGIDNSCSGTIDEAYRGHPLFNYEDPNCLTKGVCWNSKSLCINAQWTCVYPNTYEPKETLCDFKDNDCDGIVDNIIFANPFDAYCYDGPIGTEFNSPCHPGILKCVGGDFRCVSQQKPEEEVCNKIDDDCDGFADEGLAVNEKFDIVIGIDDSGSMGEEISAVRSALTMYISQFGENDKVRFAVVSITGVHSYIYGNPVLSDFSSIQNAINALPSNAYGNIYEASYDTINLVCGMNNDLRLSWRPDAFPIYIGFTDEMGQSYTTPETTLEDITLTCINNGVAVFHWSAYEDKNDFKPICDATNGAWAEIGTDPNKMLNELNSIVSYMCAQ